MSSLSLSQPAEATQVRAFGPDLNRAALKALAVEGYRSGQTDGG